MRTISDRSERALGTRPAAATITHLTPPRPQDELLAEDVIAGLTGPQKRLPPIHFYDARGSELFERITELDEYYPTDAEAQILADAAQRLLDQVQPFELLELGSGSSTKTALLLAALERVGGQRYAALEISGSALTEAADRLASEYPWLQVDGYVGDFHRDLTSIPRQGRRMILFLGSTLGNLELAARSVLLQRIADALEPGDALLLGIDLVKGPEVLIPAYDDADGVTAQFNRNVLRVINRQLDGDIPLAAFEHRAVWDPTAERIEMHLVARRDVDARLEGIGLDLHFTAGEHIVTEHSYKFRLDGARSELSDVGLKVAQVVTDPQDRFAVVLATKPST